MNDITSRSTAPVPKEYGQVLEEQDTTDLRDYWFVIYRHRWVALIFLLSTVFLAALSIPWGQPLYTATTSLYIQSQGRGMFDSSELLGTGNNYQETQLKLLRSRSLIAEVVRDVNLAQNPSFHVAPQSILSWSMMHLRRALGTVMNWLLALGKYLGTTPEAEKKAITPKGFELGAAPGHIDRYLAALTVSPIPESYLVQLQFTSVDPLLSQTVINQHAATFISRNLATRFELTEETRQFLERKLVDLRVKVENSEKALSQFQREHKIVSLDKGSNLLLDQLRKLNTDLTEARSKRIELESIHRLVANRDNQLLSQIIDNPFIQQLRKQINDLDVQIAQLSTKFKPTYRGVIALQQEKDEAKTRLDQEINRVVRTIERDYRAGSEKERALAIETESARRVALDLQEKAVDYAVLEREVASNRALYEGVFKKTQEAALTGGEPIPTIRVIDRAEIPLYPDDKKGTRTLLLSLAVGLLGGIGLAFLLHVLDTSVRTPEDVARYFRLPTLGVVPAFAQLAKTQRHRLGYTEKISPPRGSSNVGRSRENELVISHHPLSLMAEMYRSICTAIVFSKADKPPRTILITSSKPNEGKTVTSINIAMMLAQSHGPVLLIDADLHGGQCHKLLGITNGTGLTNVLTGNGHAAQFIRKTNVKNLSLLGRGTLPPNPADLLGSETMRQTLAALATDFRFIVIDSAPLLPVSDSVFLAAQVDGVILVTRGREVSRSIVRKARERLDYVDAKVLGVVLNGVDILSAEYSEDRYLYQSHYSRYAEGRTEELWNAARMSGDLAEEIAPAGSPQIVPPKFFDEMAKAISEFAGPMASIIVSDHIAAFGESRDAFPHSRVNELIDAVGRCVPSGSPRISFAQAMLTELQSFTSDRDFTAPPPDNSRA